MILVFLGPPGCGKGTQSQFLCNYYNFYHLSTGEMLRSEVENKSEFGLKIAATMKVGLYVSDEIILDIVKKNLDQAQTRDVLFDGFPRTLVQAQSFESVLERKGKKIDFVISFSLDDFVLVERIAGRFNCVQCGRVYHKKNNKPQVDGICDNCGGRHFARRDDDTQESLEKRLKIYYETTHPLIDFYKDKGILVEIDSAQSLDRVKEQVLSVINRA